tara:strand:- start:47 stop:469 length:423 start_codon:yes stop_codon:yes gene_type:complete
MGKKERLQRRVKRIDDRFIEKVERGKKGTDMDIANHEARIQRLADKGGFSAPFMAKSPLKENGGIKTPSIVEENPEENPTFTPGTPWSQYSDEEVKANAGSGKPLPTQYYQGRKVNPNINDAWQTDKQAQATEDLENTNN